MSDAKRNPKPHTDKGTPSAADIQAYLLKHPEFFNTCPDLLRDLQIPHLPDTGEQGSTVSLIERQVDTLRKENKRLTQQLNRLLVNARTNDQLFEKTKTLILALLKARDLSDLKGTLERTLTQEFGSSCCRLWLLEESEKDTTLSELGRLLESNKPYCGVLSEEERKQLFLEQWGEVGSAAVLPLHHKANLYAILAIGNADKDYYRDNMSTVLLAAIGEITSGLIQQLAET